MGWERTKAITSELSSPPALGWWLLAGVLVVIAGVLIFILHASGTIRALSAMNIWWVSLAPVGCWLLLFCLRSYLWGREVNEYQFLQKEARHAQQRWEAWAERYLVILRSIVFLPDNLTVFSLTSELPQQYGLTRRINYLPVSSSDVSTIKILLDGTGDGLRSLPPDLPLRVTLVADTLSDGMAEGFTSVWLELFPGRPVPGDITVTDSLSFSRVEERIKQPVLTADLILVMQLNGGEAYSDGLTALLLTSDDVAQKFHLPHSSRLLRPMPLDMTKFDDDITLFLETQAAACRTSSVLGDTKAWTEKSAALITRGGKMNAPWKAENIALLEKWCGIPGPFAPWLLTALAADMVSQRQQSLLALFSSEQEHFISTIIPGSENEFTG
ncbi:type VI secretion protein [Citrobacter amalonaticus]|uniref:type VI secretion protein n=1 Tax=Citrobacter amalonaticus TaxID=35703 RepID=UPI00300C699E